MNILANVDGIAFRVRTRRRAELPLSAVLKLLLFAALVVAFGADARAQTFQLPLECGANASCFIQNYADHDPGPAARDPTCGPLTYDGHDGLDFRVPAERA